MLQCDRDLQAPWISETPWDNIGEPLHRCDRCGEGFWEGDVYYDFGCEVMCRDCMDDVYRKLA